MDGGRLPAECAAPPPRVRIALSNRAAVAARAPLPTARAPLTAGAALLSPPRPAAVLELERQDPSSFQPLPFHYQELAHALFTGGVADALPREVFGDEAGRVRDLVNLVQKTRAAKVLAGLGMMTEAAAVKLNNLSAMELNSVRAFFCGALDQFHRCARIAEAGGGGGAAEAGGEAEGEAEKPARQLRRVRG